MEMELEVIDRMGFNAYFLIVWDFVKYAKDNGIAVGPGRGSAAGSIVAYCLRDHRRRPAALRPAVRALPEPRARVDAGHRHRLLGARPRAVMRYVTDKYGRESVAQIVTFGKMFPRAATRDAARVLGHDYGVGDRLAKLIPDPIMGRPPSFEDCLKPRASRCATAYDADPTAQADRRRRRRASRGSCATPRSTPPRS